MAKTQFLVVALALIAVAAVDAQAPGCREVASNQTGYLQTATPAGCLNDNVTQGLVDVACFESIVMNMTNTTGATCDDAGVVFNVSFANQTCLDGMIIGGGEMVPAEGGRSLLRGEFPLAAMEFEGVRDAAGTFTVSVDGVNCELAYGPTRRSGPLRAAASRQEIPAAAEPTATAAGARDAATTTAAEPPAAGTPAPAVPVRSSAAVAGMPAAVVMVLGAALALAL